MAVCARQSPYNVAYAVGAHPLPPERSSWTMYDRRSPSPARRVPLPVGKYLLGTILLCAVLLVAGLSAAVAGARLDLSPKRSALVGVAAAALLLAARKPESLWAHPQVALWRRMVGEARARLLLAALAMVALALGLFAPLSWLRVLPG